MVFETIKKREKVPPISPIAMYEQVSADELKRISQFRFALVRPYAQPTEAVKSSELLYKLQDDGIEDYVTAMVNEKDEVYGVMVDMLGDQFVGETGFVGSLASGDEYPIRVSTTFTHEDLRRVGLAQRRLITVNEYCKSRFNKPLSSSTDPSSAARGLWEKFTEQGLVEEKRYPDGSMRHSFK